MTADLAHIFEAIDVTWPAAAQQKRGPWTIREGRGGGSRVSAATAQGAVTRDDILTAETAMRALGQRPLFMLRAVDDDLDAQLEAAGYAVKDPVTIYSGAVSDLAAKPVPPVTAFQLWPPIAALSDVWAQGGIGPERVAIMDRVKTAKTAFLGRVDDCPAGAVFVACHGKTAMLHALEVASDHRRKGLARHLVRAVAHWAHEQGCTDVALLVTRANAGANALYQSMGFRALGGYHYRNSPNGAE